LTIPAGATTTSLSVTVRGDLKCERDETFFVDLSEPAGAVLGKARGLGTILNDDCGHHRN